MSDSVFNTSATAHSVTPTRSRVCHFTSVTLASVTDTTFPPRVQVDSSGRMGAESSMETTVSAPTLTVRDLVAMATLRAAFLVPSGTGTFTSISSSFCFQLYPVHCCSSGSLPPTSARPPRSAICCRILAACTPYSIFSAIAVFSQDEPESRSPTEKSTFRPGETLASRRDTNRSPWNATSSNPHDCARALARWLRGRFLRTPTSSRYM
mmetsp:Transcript_19451/g.45481  ORF Transcript_19451/g.45481 Transcript_19451/m.45481 type:complete len:209 (+) Transcript_19451:2-628(+)